MQRGNRDTAASQIGFAKTIQHLGFAGERQDDGPAYKRRGMGRSPANPRETALAADLITASLIRLLVVPGQYSNSADLNPWLR